MPVVDPGFSEWEGVLFGQMGGARVGHFDQKLHENEKIYTKMGGMCPACPFNQITCKNTETNIVFNDNYIVIYYIEVWKTFNTSI